jgi:hypothetical protein
MHSIPGFHLVKSEFNPFCDNSQMGAAIAARSMSVLGVHSQSISFNFMMSSFATTLGLIVRYPVIAVKEMLRRARTAGLVKRRWSGMAKSGLGRSRHTAKLLIPNLQMAISAHSGPWWRSQHESRRICPFNVCFR